MELKLSFEEAIFGVKKKINVHKKDKCVTCSGTGAEKGSKINTCSKCHGQGSIRTVKQTVFGGIAQQVVCDVCEGEGKVPEVACKTCRGLGVTKQDKVLEVNIPAGVDNGQRIRVSGEGEVGYRGSKPGDMYLHLRVSKSKVFERDGNNILYVQPISFTQATLGTKLQIDTLDGKIELKIPTGTQPGTVLKVQQKGVPYLGSAKRGDMLVTVKVVIPTKLNKKEKELLQELAKENGETVEVNSSFWENLKNSLD